MKRFLLLIALAFWAVYSSGQSPQIDSLKHLIYSSKGDHARLKAILDLCDKFETLPKDTLWNYAIKARQLSGKLKDTRSASLAKIAQANAYLRWNNADSALALIEPELLKYRAGDPVTTDIYFGLRLMKISCIGAISDYKGAIAETYGVLRQAETYKDSLAIAECLNSLSGYKYEMNFPSEAISLARKGLNFTTARPRYNGAVINICGNLAEYYYWVYKLDSGMYYADKTFNLSAQAGYVNYQAWALQKKSAIYLKAKEYSKAENAILESIQLYEKVDGKEPHDDNLVALADVYTRTRQFDKAIKAVNDALAYYGSVQNSSPHAKKEPGAAGLQRIFLYQVLARAYHMKGDTKNYEALLEKIISSMDEFYRANSAQAIADFDTKYQVQKKEATIAQQQLTLVREHYLFYALAVIGALGAIIAFLILREVRRTQKLKLQQLHEEEKLLSERAVADAEETERRRIAADLHDNLGAQLSFIKRNVDFIMDQPAGFSPEDEQKYLSSVNDIAQSAMIDLRETLWVLNKHEVSIQEFTDKLKSYLKQQLTGKDMLMWDFKEHIQADWRLPAGEVMHLFRIVQEVISNIIKHAEAKNINIQFYTNNADTYRLEIFDNGKGFEFNNEYEGHYGLENMQQRAKAISAKILLTSSPGAGTCMVLTKQWK